MRLPTILRKASKPSARFITDEASWDRLESFGAFEGGQLCGVIAVREHRTHIALFFVAADRLRQGIGRRLWDHLAPSHPGCSCYRQRVPLCGAGLPPFWFLRLAGEQCRDGIRYTPMRWTR